VTCFCSESPHTSLTSSAVDYEERVSHVQRCLGIQKAFYEVSRHYYTLQGKLLVAVFEVLVWHFLCKRCPNGIYGTFPLRARVHVTEYFSSLELVCSSALP